MKMIAVAFAGLFALTACGETAESMDHVHTVSVVDGGVLAGTHNGLWAMAEGSPPVRITEEVWDVMGFAAGQGEFFASGHPGPGMQSPADLGLQVSSDGGRTWEGRALVGDVDFHRLAAHETMVMGVDARTGFVLFSLDRGQTWQRTDINEANDVMVNADSGFALGRNQWWLIALDGTQQLVDAPLADVVTVHAAEGVMFASTLDGQLWRSTAWQGPWEAVAVLDAPATWMGSDGDTIVALVDGVVLASQQPTYEFVPLRLD